MVELSCCLLSPPLSRRRYEPLLLLRFLLLLLLRPPLSPPPLPSSSSSSFALSIPQSMADASSPPPPPPPPPPTPPTLLPPKQMTRPSLGRSGRRIDALCNHFSVSFTADGDAVQYSVSIADAWTAADVSAKDLNRTVMSKLYEVYGASDLGGKKLAYDGEHTLYTMGPLGFRSQEFKVVIDDATANRRSKSSGDRGSPTDGDNADDAELTKKRKVILRGREFNVKISHAADVKMAALLGQLQQRQKGIDSDRVQDATRVLDIVLREHSASKGFLLVRDNFFSPAFGASDIGEGVQTCNGYHISFRPTLHGLSLNMDVATTTVYKSCWLLEFVSNRFNLSDLRAVDWNKAKRFLKGVKVENRETGVVYRITGFTENSAANMTFMWRKRIGDSADSEEKEVTVALYYEMKHGKRLKYPDLPCIMAGRKKRPDYVPVELCFILEGQRYTKQLTNNQRQKMIDQARRHPEQQKTALQKAMEGTDFGANPLLQEFNIKVDKKMRKVPARVLDAPSLIFGRNAEERPNGGRWNFNNKVFVEPCKVKSWVVLNFNSRLPPQAVNRIAQDLAQACINKGLEMPRQPEVCVQEPHQSSGSLPPTERVNNMIRELRRRLPSGPPDFMLCILPVRKTSDIYGPLKRISETELNIVTQCISPPNQAKDQYFTNVALKINVKMGGMNSYLSMERNRKLPKISEVPTIIFGMDVSHGPAGFSDSPSIAAVVASRRWPCISKYGVRLHAQSRKQEMISGLYETVEDNGESKAGGMIIELLRDFYGTCITGVPDRRPSQVIVFRDGVSESQFEQTLREEFLAFKKAFNSMPSIEGKTYNPKFTYIVVQKRHHTRFFPQGGSNSRSGNVDPGTIVDDGLCHPKDYDFYLCAHAGLIGTSRPAHYQVLVDENNFSVDELQMIVYSLCYTYARSTTAVSTVAPVAYAHLAAMHARSFLDSDGGSETSSFTNTLTMSEMSERIKKLPELTAEMKKRMFFC